MGPLSRSPMARSTALAAVASRLSGAGGIVVREGRPRHQERAVAVVVDGAAVDGLVVGERRCQHYERAISVILHAAAGAGRVIRILDG
jgi:hypothetical protein